jgi:hypothetical protein
MSLRYFFLKIKLFLNDCVDGVKKEKIEKNCVLRDVEQRPLSQLFCG